MSRFCFSFIVSVLAVSVLPVSAQTSPSVADEDVVIAIGQKSQAGFNAMQAFNAGDYETAEIEFERHFDALKRSDRATRRAAQSSRNASLSSQLSAGAGSIDTNGAGGGSTSQVTVNVSTNTSASNAATQSGILRKSSRKDRNVTYEDFAFARYMTGLSQLQLGKFTEAKLSLRESVEHNYRNYDAQMRLGLLELREGEVLLARKRLIKLDKMRKACKSCKDKAEIKEATLTLAKALTDATTN